MRHRAAKLSITFAVALAGSALALSRPSSSSAAASAASAAAPRRGTQTQRRRATPAPRADYTRFRHETQAHRQACDSCHKFPSSNWKEARAGQEAFEDVTEYPEHASCVGCHRPQFFARERPRPKVCSVCHVAVTPRDQTRKFFPNPVERFRASQWGPDFESDFRVRFPHDKHADLFGMNARPRPDARALFVTASLHSGAQDDDAAKQNASCANCHQLYRPQGKSDDEYASKPPKDLGDNFWLKKGTFMTTPTSHSTCFTCHSAESGLKPGQADCATCHVLQTGPRATQTDFDPKLAAQAGVTDSLLLAKWRHRDASATFRHEGGMHPALSCATCHKVAQMDTADERTQKLHVISCGGGETGCHITPTSDDGGVFNFEMEQRKAKPSFQCTKCHLTYGRLPAPVSHAEALPRPKAD
jgi:hypothetical protein